MVPEPFTSPTDVYFGVNGTDSEGDWFNYTTQSSPLSLFNTSETNINLNIIKVSGTVMVNGSSPQSANVQMYRASDNQHLGGVDVDTSGTWKVALNAFDQPTNVYFLVSGTDSKGYSFSYTTRSSPTSLFNTSVSGINFNITTFKVSGTVTVNGAPPREAWVAMYRVSDYTYLSGASVDTGGNWKMGLEPFANPTDVYFQVNGTDSKGDWFNYTTQSSPTSLYNQNKSDINLIFP
jgi:hypothetical protein